MKSLYSRQGDDGYTNLLGEGRVPKFHPQPTAYGSVDEVSSTLGLAKSLSQSERIRALTTTVQRDLYNMMAELAATSENAERFRVLDSPRVEWLESLIEEFGAEIDIPSEFIVPGDSLAGAAFDLARTVTRRAERAVAKLHVEGSLESEFPLKYLNRLSSLCFVLSIWENSQAGSQTSTTAKEPLE